LIYRQIVERKLRRGFDALNRGDHSQVMSLFAARFEHVFFGDHALGGARHRHMSIVPWYARLKLLFPDLRFEVQSVAVRGLPWDTVAMVEWRDHFTLRDGAEVGNQGVHVLRLKWGEVVSLRIYCDTQVVAAALQALHLQGVQEAACAPITDDSAAQPQDALRTLA
jgi:ketosteroid isomerase-like protein